ncbi:polyphosphate kinase 2 [Roseivirga pacifica]|uniref:ADP/GDP-polyphosphate phosphotransferase n=1 Tax=Roseivirga pacifica TaxID=1267423 RepID=A0A1I0R8I8_9BACT|nr:polyphosphate kinase 2 [Roseivirga pacifica]RKQ49199.1 polyphosphate kinase 2 [Roseivirga pacifica]SEW36957.1 polyphosphate kinase 2, PA0141 family [Roseivirga pacifica]
MSEFLITDHSVTNKLKPSQRLTNLDFSQIKNRADLEAALQRKGRDYGKAMFNVEYERQLEQLQVELVKWQRWVAETKQRVAVIFEGRDAAGKGGSIKRFVEHMNPRSLRVVALNKPTDLELGQWYFRRYIKELPNAGEIVFFDRSWYNRAVVEPVMGFCTEDHYQQFMRQVPEFEHMLFEDGVHVIKLWFSITKEEQSRRFDDRRSNPLKHWKLSPVDEKGQEMWERYTYYKEQMFARTHTTFCPWTIIKTNTKKVARLESIRHVLSKFEYQGKENANTTVLPDPNVVMRFHRSIYKLI